MALIQYEITYIDETTDTVTPIFADTLAFERHLRANPRLGTQAENQALHLVYRLWSAMRREGRTAETWDDFMPRVGDVARLEPVDTDDEPDTDGDVDFGGGVAGESTPPAP